MNLTRNPTRPVRIGSVTIGAGHPIAVQSMTATATRHVDATVAQVNALAAAGADVVRIAVDSLADLHPQAAGADLRLAFEGTTIVVRGLDLADFGAADVVLLQGILTA